MSPVWRFTFFIPWIVVVGIFIWLINMRIPLSGVREFRFPLDGRSPWFDAFLPGERVTPVGVQAGGWIGQSLLQEPVYAGMRLPGVYSNVLVGLQFRPNEQPLIDEGLRQEPGGGETFAMQPLWSRALSEGWKPARWRDREGYVRTNEEPSALGDQNLDHLLVWHASTTVPLWMDKEPLERDFPLALRGSHDLIAVPVEGVVHFDLRLQDMNRRREHGTVVFSLSKNSDLLWSDALGLAGSRDQRPSAVYDKTIEIRDLGPGAYKLSITADDDVFIRGIRSPLRHWVIGPRLYLADQIGYATTTLPGLVWTNARHMVAETFHEEGLQTLSFGSAQAVVEATHKVYKLDRSLGQGAASQRVSAPRGDVRLLGDGYFALAPDLLFLPMPRRLTDASDLDAEGIKAVLTPYVAPKPLGDGWYESSNQYSLQPRLGTLRMTVGAPGLLERGASIGVRGVHLMYARQTLSWRDWWKAVFREAASIWHAL